MKTFLQQAIAKRFGSISQLSIKSFDVCSCPQAQVGILFSGGLDSTAVAALTDNKTIDSASYQIYASPNDAPDRQTALSSFEDLRRLNSNGHWHLILTRSCPCFTAPETVLNDHLSIALWFAARGRGRSICSRETSIESQQVEFTTSAKVRPINSITLTWL
ncbi:unnamed protein product [Hymenolepis diminuta]|uniref:Asparagine synthetase domain-containing protein n=1 Tax=Hymenolepis diminuta TaxID=6216 RepID=A0A564YA83_HYMDI|nr:unnamed protein product [Hymenolepis diminuta]